MKFSCMDILGYSTKVLEAKFSPPPETCMYVLVSQLHEPNKIEKGHYKVDLVTVDL